jgi:putative flavoprotein involved in K+ transport
MMYDVIVVGAGQAGLATAHALQKAGLNFCLLEASTRAAGSWPAYYDSLTLFSPARYSGLPELAFAGDKDRYPTRDEVVDYLEGYAQHFAFPIQFNTRVMDIRQQEQLFCLETTHSTYYARAVVLASGPFNQPNIPNFKGLVDFKGQVLHSSVYHSPQDIQGKRVAVVGAGNSALQIAYELSATHDVILTSRLPPQFQKQRVLGQDIHFWLKWTGLDTGRLGRLLMGKETPVLDQGIYQHALNTGRIQYKPLFTSLTTDSLQWSNETLQIDSMLLATGFKAIPHYIQALLAQHSTTHLWQKQGVAQSIKGLYVVGMPWQRSHASATIRGVGEDARFVVKHLQAYLKHAQPKKILQGCC